MAVTFEPSVKIKQIEGNMDQPTFCIKYENSHRKLIYECTTHSEAFVTYHAKYGSYSLQEQQQALEAAAAQVR